MTTYIFLKWLRLKDISKSKYLLIEKLTMCGQGLKSGLERRCPPFKLEIASHLNWAWLIRFSKEKNLYVPTSVTRLGDLLDLKQLFKAFGNNNLQHFCIGVKIYHFFEWNHFWATFIGIWRLFSGHTAAYLQQKRGSKIKGRNFGSKGGGSRVIEFIERSPYNTCTHFKRNTKSIDIYSVLRCCVLMKKSNYSESHEMG